MMTHPDDFLDAILEQPELDEPRLAYADWLDEHCNPLGEFIRVQCRLAGSQAGESLWELEQREQELLAEFEGDWAAELAGRVDWWVFRRGFVAEVSTSATQF